MEPARGSGLGDGPLRAVPVSGSLMARVLRLEAGRAADAGSRRLTPDELQEAARLYEESLGCPEPADPRQAAYLASRSVHEIAADTYAMLGGAPAPAPWL